MRRNRFHTVALVFALGIALVSTTTISIGGAVSSAEAATSTVSKTITFAPGTSKLTSLAQATLYSQYEKMRLAPAVSIIGFTSFSTAKTKINKNGLARANAIKGYLKSLGLTVPISVASGGLSSKFAKAAVADRATVSFTPTPGLLWIQDFNEARGTAPSARDFTGLNGDGCDELGLCTYGTGEMEYNDPSAASTDGQGNLVIHTTKVGGTWISARIWTAQKLAFQYGDLEIRAKFPTGSFNWPAIWMLGNNYAPPNQVFGTTQWPTSGELDIAEGLGGNSVVQGTLHGLASINGGDWNGGGGVTAAAPLSDVSGAYHTWGIQSMPNLVIFSMDGVEYCRDAFDGRGVTQTFANGASTYFDSHSNWPFNQPFFLILNNAIPSGVNQPDGTSSDFKIDSIRYSNFMGFGQVVR